MPAIITTADDIKKTEDMLTQHFKSVHVLSIWRSSVKNKQQYKTHLISRLEAGVAINFTHDIKSPSLSHAAPLNRQPPKGLESNIDRAEVAYNNLVQELESTEADISATEEAITRLEQTTYAVAEAISKLSGESVRVLEWKLRDGKSLEDIGDKINKSKSAAHRLYEKSIIEASEWLRNIGILVVV